MNDVVCFGGSATNLPDSGVVSAYGGVGGPDCTSANGCGVHIHSGSDCTNTTTQQGHWYNPDVLTEDPWLTVGYLQTSEDGFGEYAHCVHTGYDLVADPNLLDGLAFIIHAEDGSRVSCGIIDAIGVEDVSPTILETEVTPIPGAVPPSGDDDNGVTGIVQVIANIQDPVDVVCYQGIAIDLEPDVESFLLGTGSDQCNVTNGCGVHIHSGTGCNNTEVQGGHYYDADSVAVDPWLLASYLTTGSDGGTSFVGCIISSTSTEDNLDYNEKPFIVHGVDGGRLSCGILSPPEDLSPTEAPSGASRKLFIPAVMSSFVIAAAIGFF